MARRAAVFLATATVLIATRAVAQEFTSDCDGARRADASALVASADRAWLAEVSDVRAGRKSSSHGGMLATTKGRFSLRLTQSLKGASAGLIHGRWFRTWLDDGQVSGYKPEPGETYLVRIGPNGSFLDRAACLTGVADLKPVP